MTTKLNACAMAVVLGMTISAAQAGGQIKGWWVGGEASQGYDFGTEHLDGAPAPKSAFIKSVSPAPNSFGTISQGISPTQYRGKRLRLSAMMKTKAADSAQLWLRMDGPDQKVLNFYNMNDRPVKGTADWKRYDIVLEVPTETVAIYFGYFLAGKGEAWADDFKVETVGNSTALSKPITPPLPDKPVNANFEE